MSFRSLVAAFALAISPAAIVLAQDAVQQPVVENSKYEIEGVINAGSVYVRSGPGEGYYPTQQLPKGTMVTVVGIKYDWLKILPPPGSFSYVGSAYVDRNGDGATGRINRADVNVRAGSDLNAMKTTVQTRLNTGDQVEIIGKEDEYLKIKPPADAYVYVNKQFVDVVRPVTGADAPSVAAGNAAPTTQPALAVTGADNGHATPTVKAPAVSIDTGGPIQTTTPTPSASNTTTGNAPAQAASPTTQPAQVVASATTQPAAPPPPSAEDLFGKFEAEYADMSKQPLADQQPEPLKAEYQSIAKADGLSDTLKQVVQLRIATLDARATAKSRLLEAQQIEKDNAQKQLALQAEHDELAARLKENSVEIYTAVGQLQPSSLQVGGGTLYRLIDPGTGRTVIYIRSNDPKVAAQVGQFVGVRGEPTTDTALNLRLIAPTDIAQVDPAKVNGSVAAEIIPPSLLARPASASVSPN